MPKKIPVPTPLCQRSATVVSVVLQFEIMVFGGELVARDIEGAAILF